MSPSTINNYYCSKCILQQQQHDQLHDAEVSARWHHRYRRCASLTLQRVVRIAQRQINNPAKHEPSVWLPAQPWTHRHLSKTGVPWVRAQTASLSFWQFLLRILLVEFGFRVNYNQFTRKYWSWDWFRWHCNVVEDSLFDSLKQASNWLMLNPPLVRTY